jgi:hypothetical protein
MWRVTPVLREKGLLQRLNAAVRVAPRIIGSSPSSRFEPRCRPWQGLKLAPPVVAKPGAANRMEIGSAACARSASAPPTTIPRTLAASRGHACTVERPLLTSLWPGEGHVHALTRMIRQPAELLGKGQSLGKAPPPRQPRSAAESDDPSRSGRGRSGAGVRTGAGIVRTLVGGGAGTGGGRGAHAARLTVASAGLAQVLGGAGRA